MDWEKPGKIWGLLQRYKSTRKQVRRNAACDNCRTFRRKCDDSRPCKNCVLHACANSCSPSAQAAGSGQRESRGDAAAASASASVVMRPEAFGIPAAQVVELATVVVRNASVERPFAFQTGSLRFSDNLFLREQEAAEFPFPFLRGFWDYGFRKDELMSTFGFLPPRLFGVFQALSMAMENSNGNAPQHHEVLPPMAMVEAVDDDEGTRWQDSSQVAWLKLSQNLNGQRKRLGMNKAMQTMWGGHAEEIMARVGNCELPLPHTQYRTICCILDEFLHFTQPEKTRFYMLFTDCLRRKQDDITPLFFRSQNRRETMDGRPARDISTYVRISPQEYDRGIQHPRCKVSFLDYDNDPPAASMQQNRSLYDEERIATMMRTEGGRKRLDALASAAIAAFGLPEMLLPAIAKQPPPVPGHAAPSMAAIV